MQDFGSRLLAAALPIHSAGPQMPAQCHGPLCNVAAAAGQPRRRAKPDYNNSCPDCYHHTNGTSKRIHRSGAAGRCKNWPACSKWKQHGCYGNCASCFVQAQRAPLTLKRPADEIADDLSAPADISEPPSKRLCHQPGQISTARSSPGTCSLLVLPMATGVAPEQTAAPTAVPHCPLPAISGNRKPPASDSDNQGSSNRAPNNLTTTQRQAVRSTTLPAESAAAIACPPPPSQCRPAGGIPRSSAKHLLCTNYPLCRNAANLDKHVTTKKWLRELLHDASPDFRASILACCTTCARSPACSHPECCRRVAPSSKRIPKMIFCTLHYNDPCRIKFRDWAACRNAPSGCRELAMKPAVVSDFRAVRTDYLVDTLW